MKNFVFLVGIFILVSCSGSEKQSFNAEIENTENTETQSGIVHRVFVRHYRNSTLKSIRLTNGNCLSGKFFENVIGSEQDQMSDFYFAEEGDTILYQGERINEVKFKD